MDCVEGCLTEKSLKNQSIFGIMNNSTSEIPSSSGIGSGFQISILSHTTPPASATLPFELIATSLLRFFNLPGQMIDTQCPAFSPAPLPNQGNTLSSRPYETEGVPEYNAICSRNQPLVMRNGRRSFFKPAIISAIPDKSRSFFDWSGLDQMPLRSLYRLHASIDGFFHPPVFEFPLRMHGHRTGRKGIR